MQKGNCLGFSIRGEINTLPSSRTTTFSGKKNVAKGNNVDTTLYWAIPDRFCFYPYITCKPISDNCEQQQKIEKGQFQPSQIYKRNQHRRCFQLWKNSNTSLRWKMPLTFQCKRVEDTSHLICGTSLRFKQIKTALFNSL